MFLLKIFLNGLSLLKCLSRRFRKYLPMLMLVRLQNGGLNPISLLFQFFPRPFEWLLLLVSPTLTKCVDPTTITSTIRAGVHWVHTYQFTLDYAVLRASSYIFLIFSKSFYMRIVYFLVHGIRNLLQYRSWMVRVNNYVGGSGIGLTKRFEGAVI